MPPEYVCELNDTGQPPPRSSVVRGYADDVERGREVNFRFSGGQNDVTVSD